MKIEEEAMLDDGDERRRIEVKLKWHGMLCPECFQSASLYVTFTGECRLTGLGSDDTGDHEWGEESPCRCGNCGFEAPVCAFEWGEPGTVLVFEPGGEDAEPEVSWEIMVCAMAEDDEDHLTLAQSLGTEPTSWDVEVRRVVRSTGVVDVVWAREGLGRIGVHGATKRAEELFPFAGVEHV